MILGIPFALFTQIHVAISLIGIASGFVAVGANIRGQAAPRWTAIFLATTGLTVATGFAFPTGALTPAQIFGIISTPTLLIAAYARYVRRLAGPWRPIFLVTGIFALYLNSFVAVVQSFQKLAPLQALAPTQSEPPFLVAQLALLALFVAAGWLAVRRFHPWQPIAA